jgi:hypothetical protein
MVQCGHVERNTLSHFADVTTAQRHTLLGTEAVSAISDEASEMSNTLQEIFGSRETISAHRKKTSLNATEA